MKFLILFLLSFLKVAADSGNVESIDIQNLQDLSRVEDMAMRGNDEAAVRVGEFYLFGPEQYQDTDKALEFLRRAYHKYNMEAVEIMAGVYLNGRGVPPDPIRAERLYKVCAGRTHGPCQANLGLMYKNGVEGVDGKRGISKDPKKAYFWLHKAATNPGLGALIYDAAKWRNQVAYALSEKTRREIQDRVRYENNRDNVHLLDAGKDIFEEE